MNSNLKEKLAKCWAKKGVNPEHAKFLLQTLGIMGGLPSLASMFGAPSEWILVGTGILIAAGIVWIYFAFVIATFRAALKVLEKHHLGNCVNWDELKSAAMLRAIVQARNVRDSENHHGRESPITLEVRKEFNHLWSVIGPAGFNLVVFGKTEVFRRAHAGV